MDCFTSIICLNRSPSLELENDAIAGQPPPRGYLVVAFVVLIAGHQGGNAQPAGPSHERDARPRRFWPSGPLDVVAAFDEPIDPGRAKPGRPEHPPISIPPGPREYQRGGRSRPRAGLCASWGSDGRRGANAVHRDGPASACRAVSLAARRARPQVKSRSAAYRMRLYDLCGVEWGWSPAAAEPGDEPQLQGWWPSLDLETTRRLTRGSRPHEASVALLGKPGRLAFCARASARRDHGDCSTAIRPA